MPTFFSLSRRGSSLTSRAMATVGGAATEPPLGTTSRSVWLCAHSTWLRSCVSSHQIEGLRLGGLCLVLLLFLWDRCRVSNTLRSGDVGPSCSIRVGMACRVLGTTCSNGFVGSRGRHTAGASSRWRAHFIEVDWRRVQNAQAWRTQRRRSKCGIGIRCGKWVCRGSPWMGATMHLKVFP